MISFSKLGQFIPANSRLNFQSGSSIHYQVGVDGGGTPGVGGGRAGDMLQYPAIGRSNAMVTHDNLIDNASVAPLVIPVLVTGLEDDIGGILAKGTVLMCKDFAHDTERPKGYNCDMWSVDDATINRCAIVAEDVQVRTGPMGKYATISAVVGDVTELQGVTGTWYPGEHGVIMKDGKVLHDTADNNDIMCQFIVVHPERGSMNALVCIDHIRAFGRTT